MEIALKTVAGQFNALQLNFLRFLIGGLFLLPFALRSLRKRHSWIRRCDMGFFALSGLTCVVTSMTLYQLAIQSCKASIVAILFSCNPVVVIPLAAIFLKERIRGFTIATMILSVAGMVCIMNPFNMSASPAGICLTLGSAVVFAAYAVMGKTKSVAFGGLTTTAFSFIIGSGELFVLILASRIQAVAGMLRAAGFGNFADIPLFAGLDLRVLPVFAYISLCVTGIGYASYFMAIEESSSATASLVFYIKPALAPILAFLVLGESIAASTLAGIVLITLGSAISFAGSRRVKHPNRELRT
jgi:drug/metabolite transporter (DMT)-like permease